MATTRGRKSAKAKKTEEVSKLQVEEVVEEQKQEDPPKAKEVKKAKESKAIEVDSLVSFNDMKLKVVQINGNRARLCLADDPNTRYNLKLESLKLV